jgi:hypothetical protein
MRGEKRGVSMRALFFLIILLFGGAANAQQCAQCSLADACIRDYTRAIAKIKAEYKKGVADQRKGREQTLRDRFSPPTVLANPESFERAIRAEIDSLKDCLGKIK